MSEKRNESSIKVHGVPLLPPIISDRMRDYINKMRLQAVLIEKKLAEKSKKKKWNVVNMWTEVNPGLDLFDCGQELTFTEWTGPSTRQVNLINSSTQTIDWRENAEEGEQLILGRNDVCVTGFNAWTQMNKYLMECGREPTEYLILNRTSDITSSVQIELDKTQTLEAIRQRYAIKKDKSIIPISSIWKRGHPSRNAKEKWTSCPSRLGSGSTIQNDNLTKGPNEYKTTESSNEEWKRWMSLPNVCDVKTPSVGSSQNSEEFIQNVPIQYVTHTTSKLEISPDRQKSYTLVQPSKYLMDYVRKRAYGHCTSHLSNRHKSYAVIEPSKFLIDYVKTKGCVGPIEENIPVQRTSGISRMSHSESQGTEHYSYPTAPIICPKCKEEICVCNEEYAESYTDKKELESRAATIINAAVRGYLVRRLMKTRHVQQCVDTIRYTLQCHLALSSKSKEDADDSNIELHLCIMRELLKSCEEFYDTFFNISKSEQLKIIASDRLSQLEY